MPIDPHISDADLVAGIDDELPLSRSAEVRSHLAHCWRCRARRAQLENAIARFVSLRDAIDMLISFEAWHRLRQEQRLSPAQARQVVWSTVNALLDQRERTRGKP